jgi:biotin carboxyl carrier protein
VVEENGNIRTFTVTVEPVGGQTEIKPEPKQAETGAGSIPVKSSFAGSVEIADIKVKVGDNVSKGQVVAVVEAMKAEHDIKAPQDGTVASIDVSIGDEIDSSKPIMTLK